ncbi:hypothetical protein SARC_03228 [Sphaeroforma arctica JP610]|uniref:Uncharacterized protein n=1 Tax=Sphaeroforma arctica JP610 TaxID=667725 RepID=A0A0L0G694_9EUKA|nr:hypothetical protein SARC_03228 [Sphaeroforma arctica JP610]KNC84555.1 hypothetical protein SARC_03228 [Sphaeroforma arctica JP610]|eukprot:XP_014158457.1 hypothetical protein SARC_03228 [Sphaeroforma arctica JP610]
MVRVKLRYLLVKIHSETKIKASELTWKNLEKEIIAALFSLHGDYGVAQCRQWLQVKYVDPELGVAIVRCGRPQFLLVSTAMTTIISLQKTPITLRVCHVSARTTGVIDALTQRVRLDEATGEANQKVLSKVEMDMGNIGF